MSAFTNAYPQDIKILTPLRFAAALWVLLFFFGDRLGLTWREASGFIAKGYMGVDLFFILSGFILAHVYGPKVIGNRFNYGSFLWARLARLYPVHLATLASLLLVVVAGKILGIESDSAFDFGTLWGQLLMVQAWGLIPAGGWNHPAWSISAEWFAYLVFPISFACVALLRSRAALAVFLSAGLFVGLWFFVPQLATFGGASLTELTANGGALRIIPSFLMGVALWRLGQQMTLSRAAAAVCVGLSSLVVLVASSLLLPDFVTWIGLAGLIFALAETSKHHQHSALTGPVALWLGEASYALYMVHMPIDLVWFQAVGRLLEVEPGSTLALLIVIGVIVASLIGAGLLYTIIERPARAWLRAHDPFKTKPITKTSEDLS
jgi:peptidoglycan/LPS O-acetylase OafA/YrhL